MGLSQPNEFEELACLPYKFDVLFDGCPGPGNTYHDLVETINRKQDGASRQHGNLPNRALGLLAEVVLDDQHDVYVLPDRDTGGDESALPV